MRMAYSNFTKTKLQIGNGHNYSRQWQRTQPYGQSCHGYPVEMYIQKSASSTTYIHNTTTTLAD